MAHKSKTQRAKASAAKANKRDREEREAAAAEAAAETAEEVAEEPAKKSFFSKKEDKSEAKQQPAAAKKEEKKPKKSSRFQFFKDVKAEMKRVTWPSRTDVIRWSVVVVGALVFFGAYVAVLDNVIVTPALVALSGLGA